MPRSSTGQSSTSCWPGGNRLREEETTRGLLRPTPAMRSLPLMSRSLISSISSLRYTNLMLDARFGFGWRGHWLLIGDSGSNVEVGMKAIAVFPGKREIRLIDHPEPRISTPTDVKLRILEVGVCGTDKEICAFEYGTPPDGSDYLVIGHESLGEVVEVGNAVSRVKIGDLVVPMVRRPCPHETCLACHSGRQDFCYTGDFTERGIKMQNGFMT